MNKIGSDLELGANSTYDCHVFSYKIGNVVSHDVMFKKEIHGKNSRLFVVLLIFTALAL
jgi:hypothetical protein